MQLSTNCQLRVSGREGAGLHRPSGKGRVLDEVTQEGGKEGGGEGPGAAAPREDADRGQRRGEAVGPSSGDDVAQDVEGAAPAEKAATHAGGVDRDDLRGRKFGPDDLGRRAGPRGGDRVEGRPAPDSVAGRRYRIPATLFGRDAGEPRDIQAAPRAAARDERDAAHGREGVDGGPVVRRDLDPVDVVGSDGRRLERRRRWSMAPMPISAMPATFCQSSWPASDVKVRCSCSTFMRRGALRGARRGVVIDGGWKPGCK